jgi:hypothetical protein
MLMYRYIIIETKDNIQQYEKMITSLFSEFIHMNKIEMMEHQLVIYYAHDLDISLEDIILNLSQDTLIDFRLFESYVFNTMKELEANRSFIEQKLNLLNFNQHIYINNHILLLSFLSKLDKSFKKQIFRKYEDDHMMIETIKVYLESDQNVSVAAKALYIHRNTLTQRLDKFSQITGFDVKKFMDGFLIYQLLLIK